MASKKLPESETPAVPASILSDADFWFSQFKKHLEINFQDYCQQLPAGAGQAEIQYATIQAIIGTLFESGTSPEEMMDAIGRATRRQRTKPVEWTEEMNQRRVDLIDKDIQGEISPAEKVELARLTSIMRDVIETEENLPLKGAKELHKRLLQSESKEKPR